MSKHLLFILILAVCTNVFAQQTKSISGVVYDSNTGEALIGVLFLKWERPMVLSLILTVNIH